LRLFFYWLNIFRYWLNRLKRAVFWAFCCFLLFCQVFGAVLLGSDRPDRAPNPNPKIRSFGIAFVVIARAPPAPLVFIAPPPRNRARRITRGDGIFLPAQTLGGGVADT
jgi:hypothetical protein